MFGINTPKPMTQTPQVNAVSIKRNAFAMLSLMLFSMTLFFSAPRVHAAVQIEGRSYADTTTVAGQSLKLNGVGIRAVLWLKGYVAGLYVAETSADAHSLLKAGGAKRMSLIMLREADTEVFVKAVHGGIEKNLSAEEIAKLETRLASFDTAIRSIGKVKPGDVVDLDFVPNKGLLMAYNGNQRGQAIEGKEFYEAILGIFIGDNPVDKSLKQGLLGLKKPPRAAPAD